MRQLHDEYRRAVEALKKYRSAIREVRNLECCAVPEEADEQLEELQQTLESRESETLEDACWLLDKASEPLLSLAASFKWLPPEKRDRLMARAIQVEVLRRIPEAPESAVSE